MITKRYERGNKFLDVEHSMVQAQDEDGLPVIDELWAVSIYDKTIRQVGVERRGDTYEEWADGINNVAELPVEIKHIGFISETILNMFIKNNEWKELVL